MPESKASESIQVWIFILSNAM